MKEYLLIALVGFVLLFSSLFFFAQEDVVQKTIEPAANIKLSEIENKPDQVVQIRKQSSIQSEIFGLFQTGNFKKSYEKMMQYFEADISNSDLKWLENQYSAISVSYAYSLIHQKNCKYATEILQDAADRLGKPTLEIEKALGICAFYDKDLYLAEAYLSNYLAKKPSDYEAMLSFSEVLESLGRFEEANRLVDDYINSSGTELSKIKLDSLKTKLSLLKERQLESSLQESFQVRHFKLFYRSGTSEDLAVSVLEELEQTLADLTLRWGFREPKAIIEVILYPETDFKRLVGHGPEWASGVFDGRIRISYKKNMDSNNLTSLKKVIKHELIHALLHEMSGFRKIPSWFGEGLAQIFECLNDSCELVYPAKKNALNFKKLFEKDFYKLSVLEAKEMYIQSLFLFASIKNEYSGGERLRRIIDSINKSSELTFANVMKSSGLQEKKFMNLLMENWTESRNLNYAL